jgi:isopenicillin N synthase-like dioxygenase
MTREYASAAESLIVRGFALLCDDGELLPMVRDVFLMGRGFFAQGLEAKLSAADSLRLEGYRPMGAEYSQTLEHPDLCESFSVWRWNATAPEVSRWSTGNGLHAALSLALPAYARIANGVLEALRRRLNPQGHTFDAAEASYLQVNHYRPREFAREFLQEIHEDGHVLTIHTASGPGLEISSGGGFIPIDTADDELLLLPGTLLTLLTGGAIAPLFHRVRNHRDAVRQSLLYFVNPSVASETRPWIESDCNRDISIRSVALSCLGGR